ncbi:hypothetical protein KFE25_006031 [Diacronema lutheri]|uniref:DNA topoisomerase 1 n=2 Tax=Diacronema lutheri TaxID=2081491 RepID=A0A8J5XV60_DIALT|nr:hypothetical protein KFE25_006031 [Diacronema lutheri]
MPVVKEDSESEEDVPLSKRAAAPKASNDQRAVAPADPASKPAAAGAAAVARGQPNGSAAAKPALAKAALAVGEDAKRVDACKASIRPPVSAPAKPPVPKVSAPVGKPVIAPPKTAAAGAAAKPAVPALKRPRPSEAVAPGDAPKLPAPSAAKPIKAANGGAGDAKRREPDVPTAPPDAKAAKVAAVKPTGAAGTKPTASKPPAKPAPKPKAKPSDDDADDDESGSGSGSSSGSDESSGEDGSSDGSGSESEADSSEDKPIIKKPQPARPDKAKLAAKRAKAAAAPRKRAASPKRRPAKADDDDDDGDDENVVEGAEPWFQDKDDVNWKKGAIKWRTLEHAGVLFPPHYEPHRVPLVYAGAPVALSAEQEECATWYAAMKDTDFGQDPKFQENFFEDWRKLLVKTAEGKAVREFEKCDFSRIGAHVKEEDAKRKERSREEKEADRAAKLLQEGPFLYANIDGRKEKVGNFRVEPPGLFRGRGDHPKRGRVKKRIVPEDITINLGKGVAVPPVPDMADGRKHKWGAIVHDNTVTWLAKWKDSINGQDKCVWLAANSAWKGMSDMAKYNKARTLKEHIERVRRDYDKGMKDSALKMQQRSVAVYLIDQLALRVGNEKNTDEEADTVGCCSLRVEHVTLHADNKLELRFLGKDSIEFHQTVEVAKGVHTLLGSFCRKKEPQDNLFDQIKPQDLNDYFKEIMDGLTAKVFRTYNASYTLDRLLAETSERVTAEQIAKEGRETALHNFYSVANKEVAELCNHQRAAPKNFDEQLARIEERIDKVRDELREAKKGGNGARIEAKTRQLEKMEADKRTKIELKNVALGTSRINYNDPRITVAWCKAHDMPITKPFNKSLLSKFTWAMSSGPDWRF